MALEKFFLENGKHVDSKVLEDWLFYLLKNSRSASISAVVTSIVLAYPDKTFNIAKLLFKTKEFFFYETNRWSLDQTHKSQLLMLKNNFGINKTNEFYENERIEACDDKHRQWTLEHLFLNYQCFRNEGVDEKEAELRQNVLWEILDDYYRRLPDESEQNDSDKTWRLYLTRMDRRKMKIKTEQKDEGIAIQFNPEIDPELKEYSEKSLEKSSKQFKYTSLKLWSNYKFEYDDKYKQYEQYESDPKIALKETREIVEKLNKSDAPKTYRVKYEQEDSFYFFNYSIPAYVCSVLIRDHLKVLTDEEREFCKEIVLEVASCSFRTDYRYQISDGVSASISVLPILLDNFPEEKNRIKSILLFALFNDYRINMGGNSFSIFPIVAIHKLWNKKFDDAKSLLFGYLILKPKLLELRESIRKENYENAIYDYDMNQVFDRFLNENENEILRIVANDQTFDDFEGIGKLDLDVQKTVFQLIPLKSIDPDLKLVAKRIISSFAGRLLSEDRDDKIDYRTKKEFLEAYANFVLSLKEDEIKDFLEPFLDGFNGAEPMADFFREFVLVEDRLNSFNTFWIVWYLFKDKIVELCKDGDRYWYVNRIVESYLFATVPWKETTKEWRSFKQANKKFFKDITQKIGHCPSALYAISKLLNDIGSPYLNEGIGWIATMLGDNPELANKKLEVNTIFYLESIVKKYYYQDREKIRRIKVIKDKVLIILDFLIKRGSVVGYMLRESIL